MSSEENFLQTYASVDFTVLCSRTNEEQSQKRQRHLHSSVADSPRAPASPYTPTIVDASPHTPVAENGGQFIATATAEAPPVNSEEAPPVSSDAPPVNSELQQAPEGDSQPVRVKELEEQIRKLRNWNRAG